MGGHIGEPLLQKPIPPKITFSRPHSRRRRTRRTPYAEIRADLSFEAFEFEGRFFVNPGSATGAWSGLWNGEATPSFALMDIQGPVIVTYVYQLVDGEVSERRAQCSAANPATPGQTLG